MSEAALNMEHMVNAEQVAQDPSDGDFKLDSMIAMRAQHIPGNPFAMGDARVARAVANGEDVIDLSKGNPDGQPPEFMVDEAIRATHDPEDFRYTAFNGKPAFLQAAASWYQREHGIDLDSKTQLLAVSGASVGIGLVILTLINPGDLVVVPGPYYPQYEGSTAVAQGRLHAIPTDEEHDFLPDLDAVDESVWSQTKLLILNYPNNPTGAVANPEFFAKAVALAKRYHFIIMHDFAYAGIGFDEKAPISLLETPGAMDVSVELCSLSKMYMVAGWRGGFIAGNPVLMDAIKCLNLQTTLLVTSTVLDAGAAALNSDQASVRVLAARYRKRFETLKAGLAKAGLHLCESHGGLFAWMRVPQGENDRDFTTWLLHTAGIAVLAGSDFGPTGAGFVRLSLLKPESELAEATRRISAAMQQRH
ncbi:MAG: aminotransferase class I/II-fold pyridoxal phosphate-dependent enzyme [Bifidobacterium aquikefiri]|uniref:Class I and II aminotransferase n=2 Tax=Bifidobacterium aquikefiri TaxID=1653207 RepID=A0A261G7D2_9BIFI|nr:aminotransferase class I/II-fold pyridoxal phosphate-dependent enzyme [Bifidobacterium aquikefiri]OZG67103.1 class I and II aminotransferase [Bifidobacterium aquikefiri]